MPESAKLTRVEQAIIVAAYYRGGSGDDRAWISNSDQIVTLSLFYSGQITVDDCAERFSRRSCVGKLYRSNGDLTKPIESRYRRLVCLIRAHPELIEGGGDFDTPAHPTYTSCRLTSDGLNLARALIPAFREKPKFPNWPDKRGISKGQSGAPVVDGSPPKE